MINETFSFCKALHAYWAIEKLQEIINNARRLVIVILSSLHFIIKYKKKNYFVKICIDTR